MTSLAVSANAARIFTETFDSYGASDGDALNTLGTNWTANSAYTLTSNVNTEGLALFSGTGGSNAAISYNLGTTLTDTFYVGVDFDYGINGAGGNFFLFGLSNGADDANTAAAVFGSNGTPTVTARAFGDSGYSAGSTLNYGDEAGITGSVRLVMEVSKSGANGANYDTITITDITGTTTYSTVTGDIGVSELDTVYARLGGVAGNGQSARMLLDNLSVATTFADAASIPEPSAFAMLAGLCGLASVAIRRRRR